MDRKGGAPISWHELASLRRLMFDPKHRISSTHRQLLLSMGLIAIDGGELTLTEAGRSRLDIEDQPPSGASRSEFT